MAEPTELDDWARRYLDLWEDQVATLAADRDFAKLLLAQISAFGSLPALAGASRDGPPDPSSAEQALKVWRDAVAATITRAAEVSETGRKGGFERDGNRATGDAEQQDAAPGPTPPAPASEPQHLDLDVFSRRLADLEARVAALESPARKTPRRTGSRGRSTAT